VGTDPGGKGASFKGCCGSEELGGREEDGAREKRKCARLHGKKGMKKTNLGQQLCVHSSSRAEEER